MASNPLIGNHNERFQWGCKNTRKMAQIYYQFPRKWHTVLYELFRVFSAQSWEPMSIEEAWNASDKAYLRFMGITTYLSFEHHVRRLKQRGYLYRLPRPKRDSIYDSNHYTYLFSKAGITRLIPLGVVPKQEQEKIKKIIIERAHDYGVPLKRKKNW